MLSSFQHFFSRCLYLQHKYQTPVCFSPLYVQATTELCHASVLTDDSTEPSHGESVYHEKSVPEERLPRKVRTPRKERPGRSFRKRPITEDNFVLIHNFVLFVFRQYSQWAQCKHQKRCVLQEVPVLVVDARASANECVFCLPNLRTFCSNQVSLLMLVACW